MKNTQDLLAGVYLIQLRAARPTSVSATSASRRFVGFYPNSLAGSLECANWSQKRRRIVRTRGGSIGMNASPSTLRKGQRRRAARTKTELELLTLFQTGISS